MVLRFLLVLRLLVLFFPPPNPLPVIATCRLLELRGGSGRRRLGGGVGGVPGDDESDQYDNNDEV